MNITFTILQDSDIPALSESEITITSPVKKSGKKGDGHNFIQYWHLPDMAIAGIPCKEIEVYKLRRGHYGLYAEGNFGIDEDGELIDFIDVTLKDVQVMENAILAGLKK